jgi:hypothetical protein
MANDAITLSFTEVEFRKATYSSGMSDRATSQLSEPVVCPASVSLIGVPEWDPEPSGERSRCRMLFRIDVRGEHDVTLETGDMARVGNMTLIVRGMSVPVQQQSAGQTVAGFVVFADLVV